MLQLHNSQIDVETGIGYYLDNESDHRFYPMPNGPRFRLVNGLPVFKFIKYREDPSNTDPNSGGGFCLFDVEFVVPEDQLTKLKKNLQDKINQQYGHSQAPAVEIAAPSYTKGTADLILIDDTQLIKQAKYAGKPSLYGNNVLSVALELTRKGAIIFEQAMQGGGASFASVAYHLSFMAALPPITGYAEFNATEFYSFFQTIHVDDNLWSQDSYRETLREQMINSKAEYVHIDPGWSTDPDTLNKVSQALYSALDNAVQSKMIDAITPVGADDRKRPDGFGDVTRDVTSTKIANFYMSISQGMVIEYGALAPQGNLPPITTLTGPDGKPLDTKVYFQEIDLNDPFYRTLNVSVLTNADFDRLPIFAVQAHLDYGQGSISTIQDYLMRSPNDVGKFATYIENNYKKYKYWYEVSYKGQSKTFKSAPVETDETQLQILVDDLGILMIDIEASGINFDQISQAIVTVQYEDTANGIQPIEQQFTLDKTTHKQQFQAFLFQPRRNQYYYQTQYLMVDGKQYQGDRIPGRASTAYIHSPFAANKKVGFRAVGDLKNDIDTIFFDATYTDATNHYTQTISQALNNSNSFFDWTFPVISETQGTISYTAEIHRKIGSVTEVPASPPSTGNTFLIGDKIPGFLVIKVYPDAIDFTTVKFAEVTLHYVDQANSIDVSHDLVLRKGATDILSWSTPLKNTNLTTYTWQATFFMQNGTKIKTNPVQTSEDTIIPDPGDAK